MGDWIRRATPPGLPWMRKLLGDDLFANVTPVQLTESQVADAELEHIGGLTQLRVLGLNRANVSDAGLRHIEGLTHLGYLGLSGTEVTNAGVEKLQLALPNCDIRYDGQRREPERSGPDVSEPSR